MLVKRVMKELESLVKEKNDFLVSFNESNISLIDAIIKAPIDSLYKNTFVRVKMVLPENYPFSPPKVTFINYKNTRIHPNLYGNGKVCLSILGTWPGEPWCSTMRIETVLRVIQSILDNTPYIHEPNCKNDKVYNEYVRFETYDTLLFNYIKNEKNDKIKNYIVSFVKNNYKEILKDLNTLNKNVSKKCINTKYCMKANINYEKYIIELNELIN